VAILVLPTYGSHPPKRIAMNTNRHPVRTIPTGEADLAALLLRTTLGGMLATHGINKVTGPGGLEGTTRWFAALGLRPAAMHARMAAATEISAGTLLAAGVLSPLPAAATIGLMTTAALTDHRGKGFFVFKGGWEYTAVVAAAAAALAALGPGRWSLDALVDRQRQGLKWALAATVLGVGTASGLVATSYRPEPPAADSQA
jgi:putative oxidoreductase